MVTFTCFHVHFQRKDDESSLRLWRCVGWRKGESLWKRRARVSRALNLTLSFVLWVLALSFLSTRPGLEKLNRVFDQMEAKQRELQKKFAPFEVFAELSRICNVSTNVSSLKATHRSWNITVFAEGQSSRVHYCFIVSGKHARLGRPKNIAATDKRVHGCWSTRDKTSSKNSYGCATRPASERGEKHTSLCFIHFAPLFVVNDASHNIVNVVQTWPV